MKFFRDIMLFVAFLLWGGWVQADERSAELLAALQKRVEAMAGYEAGFTLRIEGQTIEGNYRVQGDRYSMQLGDAAVYSDGRSRWEVDPSKREVVVDVVDLKSHNILQNPTRAFLFLEEDYDHCLRSEAAGRATLRLTPKGRSSISAVTLVLDVATATPRLLIYEAEDEQLQVVINSFTATKDPVPAFDAGRYPDYELIDFR